MSKNVAWNGLAKDLSASVVVLLVALPLCLGIALGSGAPLISGLIAGVVGGVVVGFLSGSPLSVSGPAAGLTTIVAAAITKLPSYEAFALAVMLAGAFQVLLGVVRAGVVGDFIPNSVIKGMLAAIGLILILKQFPHLVGYDADFEGDESFLQSDSENTLTELYHAMGFFSLPAALIGVVSILLLLLWERPFIRSHRLLALVPGPLVVVAVGILMQVVMARVPELALSAQHMVDIPNIAGLSGLLSVVRPPDLQMLSHPSVWLSAATLAIVASLESLLGVEAVDKLDPLKRVTPANRELMAQGAGNMVSGMLGGLPVTSVVVRSSANVQAGAVSKRSTILHGVLMLFGVLLMPTVIDMIPYAALAAILMVTGYKLVKVNTFKEFHAKGWEQFIPFVVTILAILFSDLLTGIVIGIFVGLFFMMRSNFRTTVLLVKDGENHLLRLRKDVSFLNKPIVKQRLASLPNGSYILIDTNPADFIDQDVLEVIREFIVSAPARNIRVEVKRSMQGSIHPMLVMSEQPHVS